jgi:hypothetical protein
MRAFVPGLLALAVLLPPGAAGATEFRGRMQCEILAAVSPRPLDQVVTVTIRDGEFRYERPILNPQGQHVGGYERGSGRIGADRSVTVTGSGTSGNFAITTRLTGRVAPNGAARLEGTQHWSLRGQVSTRTCTLTVAGR